MCCISYFEQNQKKKKIKFLKRLENVLETKQVLEMAKGKAMEDFKSTRTFSDVIPMAQQIKQTVGLIKG